MFLDYAALYEDVRDRDLRYGCDRDEDQSFCKDDNRV